MFYEKGVTKTVKKQSKIRLLMYSNVSDDVTNFDVCGFTENIEIIIS